jgi:hypothetical protein
MDDDLVAFGGDQHDDLRMLPAESGPTTSQRSGSSPRSSTTSECSTA